MFGLHGLLMCGKFRFMSPTAIPFVKRFRPFVLVVLLVFALVAAVVPSVVPSVVPAGADADSDLEIVRRYDVDRNRKIELSERSAALVDLERGTLSIDDFVVVHQFYLLDDTLPVYPDDYSNLTLVPNSISVSLPHPVPSMAHPVASLSVSSHFVSGVAPGASVVVRVDVDAFTGSGTKSYKLALSGSAVEVGGYFAGVADRADLDKFSFAAGETSKSFTLTAAGAVLEPFDLPQNLNVALMRGKVVDASALIRVISTSEKSTVSIHRKVSEDSGTEPVNEDSEVKFVLSVSSAPKLPLPVRLKIERGSIAPAEYRTVQIPTGQTEVPISETPQNNVDDPVGSKLMVTVEPDKNYRYLPPEPPSASATFTDDDATVVTLVGSSRLAAEGETREFMVRLGRPLQDTEELTVYLGYDRYVRRGVYLSDDVRFRCVEIPGVMCTAGEIVKLKLTGSAGNTVTGIPIFLDVVVDSYENEYEFVDVDFVRGGDERKLYEISNLDGKLDMRDDFAEMKIVDAAPPLAIGAWVSEPVTEGVDRAVGFGVVLDEPAPESVRIPIALLDESTATNGRGYDFEFGDSYVVKGSRWSSSGAVVILDDHRIEDTETIVLGVAGQPENVFTVTVRDNDIGGATAAPAESVVQINQRSSYTIVLDAIPEDYVTIEISASEKIDIYDKSLIFKPSNWNVPQTVSLLGVQTGTAIVSHKIVSNDQNFHNAQINDTQIMVRSPGVDIEIPTIFDLDVINDGFAFIHLREGEPRKYEIALEAPPTSNVIVQPEDTPLDLVNIAPLALTFTTTNWMVPQTVVIAVKSPVTERGASQIQYVIDSEDPNFDNAPEPRNIIVARIPLPVIEIDSSRLASDNEYTIKPSVRLFDEIRVSITVFDTGVAKTATRVLVFNPMNWRAPQTVAVLPTTPGRTTITHTVSSADMYYQNIRPAQLRLSVVRSVTGRLIANRE